MNSTFVVISTLLRTNIEENCLIKCLMNVSTKRLINYLECAFIYKGTSPKKKTDLIEMIAYECITGTLNKKDIECISTKKTNQVQNKNNIIDSLIGSGDMGLKKEEIKPFANEKTFTDVTK